jgi:hypothetical protein
MRGTHLIVGVGHGPQRFVVVRHGLCGRCRGSPIVAGITTSIVIDCVSDFLACSTVIGEVACCYGRSTVVSDLDGWGFVLNVRWRKLARAGL